MEPIQVSDANRWLQPPFHTNADGSKREYALMSVTAEGAFIRLRYTTLVTEAALIYIFRDIEVYLNDNGREVLRTSSDRAVMKELNPEPPAPAPAPLAVLPWRQRAWERIKRFWNAPQPFSD